MRLEGIQALPADATPGAITIGEFTLVTMNAEGRCWAVGRSLADLLHITAASVRQLARNYPLADRRYAVVDSNGGPQRYTLVVSAEAAYEMILRSRRPAVRDLRRALSEAGSLKVMVGAKEWPPGYRERFPEKAAAHDAVAFSLRSGALLKPVACESCGDSSPLDAHHPDYAKPLAVQWLCRKCHSGEHQDSATRPAA